MMRETESVLAYDGTYTGFLSCLYTCFKQQSVPADIVSKECPQTSLFPVTYVGTRHENAGRMSLAIERKLSARSLELIEHTFLSCLERREMRALRYLIFSRETGRCAADLFAHPDVYPLIAAERHLCHEAHLLSGFIRFSEFEGKLVSMIDPKNQVLPLLAPHFTDRYQNESLLIYDRTHRSALVYFDHVTRIGYLDHFDLPDVSEEERTYRSLWRNYYQTIAIKERYNPVCRRGHMPERYWYNMTEMRENDP